MSPHPTLNPADQLFHIVEAFLKALAAEAWKRRLGLYLLATWQRVRGLQQRFAALYGKWKAGTLPQVRARREGSSPRPPDHVRGRLSPQRGEGVGSAGTVDAFDPGACDAASVERARLRPTSVLPRTFGWMQRMLPGSAGLLAGGMDSVVRHHPEVRAFIADCPQAGRILRPLYRMVGLKPPDFLALPKRVRTSPRPSPQSGEGEVRRRMAMPRRRDFANARDEAQAWMQWSAATKKPVDPRKMSAVAFGYILHWPRDGNCPPPEIGYGGRVFPPLPKDYEWPKD